MTPLPLSSTDSIKTALDLLQTGAPASYLLLLLSVSALSLILLKLWELWDQRLGDPGYIGRALMLYHRGQPEDALTILQEHRGPLPATLTAAVAALSNIELTRDEAENFARVYAHEQVEDASALLRPLAVIGWLTPLTGLLGTLLAVIAALHALPVNCESTLLADTLGAALWPLVAGLGLAIVCIAAHQYFLRRVERLQRAMESGLVRLFTPPVTLPGAVDPTPLETLFGRRDAA
jgi:biopolymer transport protein ExbB